MPADAELLSERDNVSRLCGYAPFLHMSNAKNARNLIEIRALT